MKIFRHLPALCLAGALVGQLAPAQAQSSTNEVIRGPFFSGTIRGPKSNEAIAMKGIVVTLGTQKNAYVCYDTDLLRLSMGWTGPYLEFGNTQSQIAWPPPPQVKGSPSFSTKAGPGWASGESLADPRPSHQGPLPRDLAHYRGLYVHNDQVILSYTVGKTEVLEMPGYETVNGQGVFTRTLSIGPSRETQTLSLCSIDSAPEGTGPLQVADAGSARFVTVGKNQRVSVGLVGGGSDLKFTQGADELRLQIPAHKKAIQIKLVISGISSGEAQASFTSNLKSSAQPVALEPLLKGGQAKWTETIVTKGTLGTENEPYVADTLNEPAENPYNAKTFFGGFDFFSDGRAAICTFHGDVWVVSGIDDSLGKLTWKRYATGLFQPLGLKIVKNNVYVLGRDQITLLRDINKDGEADYYENFNNDTVVTANYHEFCLDLDTDQQGNFYFAKGAPWEPEVTSPNQGCLFKVSKDGSKLEVIATGLRAPNGMAVGPRNEITVSDNQGHWMPSSKLNWVKKGGFYGMTPAAQRELTFKRGGTNFVANPSDPAARTQYQFKSWDAGAPQPLTYDQPLCWLPMNMDNSSGGQVWATSKKWGPLQNQLLFMSYGKCSLFQVMVDEVDGTHQGAMVRLPIKFNSGVMRARFNPKDGQLYLCGLKGWQTSAARNGGFYRVRYTNQKAHLPRSFHATQAGVKLTFTDPVDAKTAADPGNYSAERWNYLWTGAYGSPEFSVTNPEQKGHDKLDIKNISVSDDKKSVFLAIDNMKPSDQFKLKYSIDAADGKALSQEIYGTVHKLGADKAR